MDEEAARIAFRCQLAEIYLLKGGLYVVGRLVIM